MAAGWETTIYGTSDGGATWENRATSLGPAIRAELNDVLMFDPNTAIIVGGVVQVFGESMILYTTNAGYTWTRQNSNTASSLYSVSFFDANDGIAVGRGAKVLRTTNAGATWENEVINNGQTLNGVQMLSAESAIAVGGNGTVFGRAGDHWVSVLLTDFRAHTTEVGIELEWSVFADEEIMGFELYRCRVNGDDEHILTDDLIDATRRSYIDATVQPGVGYRYTLVALSVEGGRVLSTPVEVMLPLPTARLYQNHPNPFNPTTTIRYTVPTRSLVELRIYSVAGRLVRTLVSSEVPAGNREVSWDGTNDAGNKVASGIYMYRLRTGKFSQSRKMTLIE